MSTQYLALLVHDVEHTPLEVAGSVGLVLGVATIVGRGRFRPWAAGSPTGSASGRCWWSSIGGLAVSFAALPLGSPVAWLAVAYGLAVAFLAVVGAMVSGIAGDERCRPSAVRRPST